MTVLLVGIGADTTNCAPTPPVFPDGRFEYIPIPERVGPAGTTETRTYGNSRLRHQDESFATALDVIYPDGRGQHPRRDADLAGWPLHHDPNFEALTYGETVSRAAYVGRLRRLVPGDVVAFYTGLQPPAGGPRHRYLIGAFTVASVLDCQAIDGDDSRFHTLARDRQRALMDEHAANAHAKRFFATGELAAPDDGLIIVNGTEPGGRFDRAFRISADGAGPHHYLRDDLETHWSPEPGGNPANNAYLGGVKPAHLLEVEPETFWDDVAEYR